VQLRICAWEAGVSSQALFKASARRRPATEQSEGA
jgi:hypothetical protein